LLVAALLTRVVLKSAQRYNNPKERAFVAQGVKLIFSTNPRANADFSGGDPFHSDQNVKRSCLKPYERNPGKMTFTTASGLLPAGTAVEGQMEVNGVGLEMGYPAGL